MNSSSGERDMAGVLSSLLERQNEAAGEFGEFLSSKGSHCLVQLKSASLVQHLLLKCELRIKLLLSKAIYIAKYFSPALICGPLAACYCLFTAGILPKRIAAPVLSLVTMVIFCHCDFFWHVICDRDVQNSITAVNRCYQ